MMLRRLTGNNRVVNAHPSAAGVLQYQSFFLMMAFRSLRYSFSVMTPWR